MIVDWSMLPVIYFTETMFYIIVVVYIFTGMRKPYNSPGNTFDITNLVSYEPFGNFQHWFDEACKCDKILEPNSMALATATKWVISQVTVTYVVNLNQHTK